MASEPIFKAADPRQDTAFSHFRVRPFPHMKVNSDLADGDDQDVFRPEMLANPLMINQIFYQ